MSREKPKREELAVRTRPRPVAPPPDACPFAERHLEGEKVFRDGRTEPRLFVQCGLINQALGWNHTTLHVRCGKCSREASDPAIRQTVEQWLRVRIEKLHAWDDMPPERRPQFRDKLRTAVLNYWTVAGENAAERRLSDWDGDPEAFRDEQGRYMSREEWAERAGRQAAENALVEAVRNGMPVERAEAVALELWPGGSEG